MMHKRYKKQVVNEINDLNPILQISGGISINIMKGVRHRGLK